MQRSRLNFKVKSKQLRQLLNLDGETEGEYFKRRERVSRVTLQDALGEDDTLYFAGEATSEDYYGTILGALLSAHRVSHDILYQKVKNALMDEKEFSFFNHQDIKIAKNTEDASAPS